MNLRDKRRAWEVNVYRKEVRKVFFSFSSLKKWTETNKI